MSQFHTDSPITGKVNSPDLLGRKEFANRIGRGLLLKKGAPGLVVSIEGEWGYGKTSFINLIVDYFETLPYEERPIAFGFCPWMISGVENLVQEFLVQLASTIGATDAASEAKSAARQLVSYSKVFSALKFVPGAEPWASIVQGVVGSVGEAASSIGKLKELNLETRRQKTVEALDKLNKPIVVFIDDVDRIPPEEIYDIFRLVKSVADFPRVAFVVALDSAYVVDALKKYGISNGNLYLDKIIQARINLPVVSTKDIERLVNDELAILPEEAKKMHFDENRFRLGNFYQSAIKYMLTSPRDVKRLFNRIQLIEPTIRGEVEFADLFALESIGVKAPTIYEHIKCSPGAYTGVPPGNKFMVEKPADYVASKAKERNEKLDDLPENIKAPIKILLEELFPLLGDLGHSHSQEYCRKHGWIAATDRLLVIHSYGLKKGEISLEVSRVFLRSPEKRTDILQSVLNVDDIETFVDGLRLGIAVKSPDKLDDFVDRLSRLIEDPIVYELSLSSSGFFQVDIIRRVWWILKEILQKHDNTQKIAIIKTLLTDPARLTLGTYCLIHCLRQTGFYGDEGKVDQTQRWCDDVQLEELQKLWIENVKKSFVSNFYAGVSGKTEVLFLIYKIDVGLAKELLAPLLVSDAGLDCIAEALCAIGEDSHKGRYVSIKQKTLDSLFELDDFKKRVAKRLESKNDLPAHLVATYLSIVNDKKVYLIDMSQEEDDF